MEEDKEIQAPPLARGIPMFVVENMDAAVEEYGPIAGHYVTLCDSLVATLAVVSRHPTDPHAQAVHAALTMVLSTFGDLGGQVMLTERVREDIESLSSMVGEDAEVVIHAPSEKSWGA